MDERTREPRKITAEDINPRYNWGRHLPVLGTMGVDFEERVDCRRMHRYRLGRAQAALEKILPALYQAKVGALSLEFSNPRHAHEYAAFKTHPLPKDMILIPGVIETTSNFVEHPEVVARRIEEAVAAVGERERVIAGTDCGFGTFTNREWVIEPAVWLKLKTLRQGADIASARLWGKKSAA